MIVDRYPPKRLFRLAPDLPQTFAPELAQLDRLLDDDAIFCRIKADMARRRPHSLTLGRPGTPVEVVLRLLVLKRLHGWSYEELERFVGDSLVLRQFCRIYLEKVPDDTTLLRWAQVIAPATLAALNERVVVLARRLAVTRGRKLRLDSTVVETTIHHPSDSSLLADGVRVLSRVLRRARAVLGEGASLGKTLFRTRLRSARRLVQRLHRLGRRKGDAATEAMRQAYARLIAVTKKTCAQATRIGTALRERPEPPAQRWAKQLDTYLPRVARAIAQAARRVLQRETVPASEKIVSLFEPHSQIIVRHKAGKPVEFGRKLWLEEVDGGIISGWRLLDQPGQDVAHLMPSLVAHQARFGRPPWLVTGDRGVFSAANERRAKAAGVERVVLPAVGKVAPERARAERQRWFRRGFRFRAGIEGRISVLQRCYRLDRCRDHGEDGMGRWIGWGIVAGNLERIARTVAARQQACVA
jgi:transposase, IS5 family